MSLFRLISLIGCFFVPVLEHHLFFLMTSAVRGERAFEEGRESREEETLVERVGNKAMEGEERRRKGKSEEGGKKVI